MAPRKTLYEALMSTGPTCKATNQPDEPAEHELLRTYFPSYDEQPLRIFRYPGLHSTLFDAYKKTIDSLRDEDLARDQDERREFNEEPLFPYSARQMKKLNTLLEQPVKSVDKVKILQEVARVSSILAHHADWDISRYGDGSHGWAEIKSRYHADLVLSRGNLPDSRQVLCYEVAVSATVGRPMQEIKGKLEAAGEDGLLLEALSDPAYSIVAKVSLCWLPDDPSLTSAICSSSNRCPRATLASVSSPTASPSFLCTLFLTLLSAASSISGTPSTLTTLSFQSPVSESSRSSSPTLSLTFHWSLLRGGIRLLLR